MLPPRNPCSLGLFLTVLASRRCAWRLGSSSELALSAATGESR